MATCLWEYSPPSYEAPSEGTSGPFPKAGQGKTLARGQKRKNSLFCSLGGQSEGSMTAKPLDLNDAMCQIESLWKRNEALIENRRKLLVEIKELHQGLKRCHDRLDELKKLVNWEDDNELSRTDKEDSKV